MDALLIKRRGWVLGVLCATLTVSAVGAASVSSVRSVSLKSAPGGTRIDLVLEGAPPSANLFTLTGPDRVVLDLPRTAFDPRKSPLPAASGLVRRLRSGPKDNGTRLVFEVDGATRARRLETSDGRLALLLTPASADLMPSSGPAAGSAAASPDAVAVAAERAVGEEAAPKAVAVRSAATTGRPAVRPLVIAVDAGHGGEDPGASGPDGTHEKDVTLAIARELASQINAEAGMRAVLTRPDDRFVPLRERIHRARRAQADLFVSVHADAVPDHSVSGASVYVLSSRGASSEAAKWLADRENAADLVGGVSLDDKDNVLASVLLDLSQSAAMSASVVAAEKVLTELNTVGDVRKSRVQQAGFVVLKSPDIPSMLIETAYITNPGEEKRLRDERYQRRLAGAILSGIRQYFRDSPMPGTRLASLDPERPAEGHAR